MAEIVLDRVTKRYPDGTAELVESLGADKYVYFKADGPGAQAAQLAEVAAETRVGENDFVARVPASSAAVAGQSLQFASDPANIVFFDSRTGSNLFCAAASG